MMYDYIPAFEESKYINKRIPPISIELDYIYGYPGFDKRKSLMYVHYHSSNSKAMSTASKE